MQKPTVIFSHIPKAAGTTLHQILNRQYPAQVIFTVDFPRASVEEFKQLSEETRAGIRCLKGHMHFGLHRYLPQKCVYITILRDPLHRVISYCHHLLRSPKDLLHQEIISKNMGLEEIVTSGLASLCNDAQERLLSGIENEDFVFPYASVPKRALEAALVLSGLKSRSLVERII